MPVARPFFANLSVRDLEASKAFFAKLGFTFEAKFTDANAACMIINEGAYAMLLVEPFFRGFTTRELCDRATHSEALFAVMVDSREEVDRLVDAALAAGATAAMPATDHGFMFLRTFYDLDGHHWEIGWMDPNAAPPQG